MSDLGHKLRKARERVGLSQLDAAKKLGISNGTLSGYERNYRDPDTDTLEKMARLYEVSTDWLLGLTDNPDGMAWDKRSKEEINELRDLFVNSDEPLAIDGDLVTEEEREYFYELLKVAKKRAQKQKEE